MADITYNNIDISGATNLVTFTDVPNILKVSDITGGTKARVTLSFSGDMSTVTTGDAQFYITIFDETITNILNYNSAANKSFYVSTSTTSTAASVTRALRNCPNIAANFIVQNNDNVVTLIARDYGSIIVGNNPYSTNILSAFLTITVNDGYSLSDLQGALIDVDVYKDEEYVTTLEKNWYDGEAAFDVSPVLTTISKHGFTTPYTFRISSIKDGEFTELATSETNYTIPAYMCNQGEKYLFLSGASIAMNASRGSAKTSDNNTILYVYENTIPISYYAHNIGGMTIIIDYIDSAYNILYTTSEAWTKPYSSNKMFEFEFQLDEHYFNQSTYVDLTMGGKTFRFNVIKPFKMTEYCQRILWRNSYGGVSFFDFTGQKSETRNLEAMTYEKNIFDYYDTTKNELEKMYDNDVEYQVTLNSHLMEKDGIYVFNDLMQSTDIWTIVNGQEYGIIIDSVSVEEQNQNDIYEATVKFHYSQKPSLV